MDTNTNPNFRPCGPQPSHSSSVDSPWPKLIDLDIVWLKDNGWPTFEAFMTAHNCKMGDHEQFISAVTAIQHLRWSRTKLPNITQAIVNAHFGLRYDSQKCLYVPISPRMQRNRDTPGPSIRAQDGKGKPDTRVTSEYDIPELYNRKIKVSSNVQHDSDNKGKSCRVKCDGDDTVEPLSSFKAWKGKSASCISEEEDDYIVSMPSTRPWKGKSASCVSEEEDDYIVSMPSTKPWKGKSAICISEEEEEDHLEPIPSAKPWKKKSVRWESDGDEDIEATSNTKTGKAPPIKTWTRKWSNEIDELRKSCAATHSKYEENEEDPEDGGIGLGERLRNLELEYETNDDDDDYYKHGEDEDDNLTLGVSVRNSSPETPPFSPSEPTSSAESLDSK